MRTTSSLGHLTAEEFVQRRSKTLIDNPQAKLNERFEVDKYISTLDPQYLKEIEEFSRLDSQPLANSVRLIVTIIAAKEGHQVRNALDTYVPQEIDPSLYEIIILDNHPEDVDRDNTLEEIEGFKKDNPHLSVLYAYKVWKEREGRYAIARKYAFDIALARIKHRNSFTDKDTILIANDADTEGLDENYLSTILKEFDTNTVVDALVTPSVVPFSSIIKPNVYAALSLWDALDDTVAAGEPYNLISRSCAYRTSIYTAIGGYNPMAKMAGDLESGWMVADSREWNPDSVIQLKKTKHVQDPRRILEAIATRSPVNEMYYVYASKPIGIQQANNKQLLDLIPNDLDWELFQEDADSFWQGRTTGMYKWRGDRFVADYKEAMNKIGVEYEIENNRVKLTNLDTFESNYEKEFGEKLTIVHSEQRAWDSTRDTEMKQLFLPISDSLIAARNKMADKISTQIRTLESSGRKSELSDLLEKYKRFAGKDYTN